MEQVISVPVADLRPSPSNPRRYGLLKNIDELTTSVRAVGVLQPIVAREVAVSTVGEREYEVVFGHRRREAAIRAELVEVPCIVREYDDDQVLEAQIIENLEREDVHPLDEADGFAELLKRGYTVGRVAERVGKPSGYVAQRLKLCGLSKACRAALDEERVTLGVALELAKLPTEKLQGEALKAVAVDKGRSPFTVASARSIIEDRVMRRLKTASFDTQRVDLVKNAGSCTLCPKRTGSQTELFPDASSPDLCTDPACFRAKLDAHWKEVQTGARDRGLHVLSATDTKELFQPFGLSGSSKWLDINGETWRGDKKVKVRSLFKNEMPELAVGRDPHTGITYELVAAKVVQSAGRRADKRADHSHETAKLRAEAEKRKAADARAEASRKARAEVNGRAVATIAQAVEKAGTKADLYVLDLLLEDLFDMFIDEADSVLERRGILEKSTKKKPAWSAQNDHLARIRREPRAQDAGWLRGLLVELVLSRFVEFSYGKNVGAIEKACKLWGVDRKAIEKGVLSEQKASKTAKSRVKAAKPGTCRECGCTEGNACLAPGGGGCSWTDRTRTLCSECEDKLRAAKQIGLSKEQIAVSTKSGKPKVKTTPKTKKSQRR